MRKKIPKEVLIGDSIWTIKYVRKIPREPKTTEGLCDPGEKIIYIKKGQSYEESQNCLIHELLHAISYEFNFYNIPHKYIYKFADGLTKFFMDNL